MCRRASTSAWALDRKASQREHDMTLNNRDTRVPHPLRSPAVAVGRLFHDAKRFAALGDARRKAVLWATFMALGTGVLLSGCAAAPGYDSPGVHEDDDDPASVLSFNSWGWRNCDCGTFGQLDRTEPYDEY
jgi:hypothetical protein